MFFCVVGEPKVWKPKDDIHGVLDGSVKGHPGHYVLFPPPFVKFSRPVVVDVTLCSCYNW